MWHFLKRKLQEFNFKKSCSIEIWNESYFKEVQCWTVKRNWWNRRYHRFPPKYNRISGRTCGNTIFYIIQQKSLLFNFVCNFLILKLEEQFFQKMFNYMKISKHNYWRRPLPASAAGSWQLNSREFLWRNFFSLLQYPAMAGYPAQP